MAGDMTCLLPANSKRRATAKKGEDLTTGLGKRGRTIAPCLEIVQVSCCNSWCSHKLLLFFWRPGLTLFGGGLQAARNHGVEAEKLPAVADRSSSAFRYLSLHIASLSTPWCGAYRPRVPCACSAHFLGPDYGEENRTSPCAHSDQHLHCFEDGGWRQDGESASLCLLLRPPMRLPTLHDVVRVFFCFFPESETCHGEFALVRKTQMD
jgi:hypothetical protein